jgi:hypothetical protein
MSDQPMQHECAFCRGATSDDPRRVVVALSWPGLVARQDFEVHFECLRLALRPGFPLMDPTE